MRKKGFILFTVITAVGILLGSINASASQNENDLSNTDQYEQSYNGDLVVDNDVTPYTVAVTSTLSDRLYNAAKGVFDNLMGKNDIVGGPNSSEDNDNFNTEFGR